LLVDIWETGLGMGMGRSVIAGWAGRSWVEGNEHSAENIAPRIRTAPV
jgi:signal transduction histidine kinase